MPVTSRAFIKASIVYLCLGAILGAIMFANRTVPLGGWVSFTRVSHIQFLLVGWLTQLVLGVAWWLFPPLQIGLRSDGPRPVRRGQTQRGNEGLFWVTFLCLNLGVLFRAVFEPLYGWSRVEVFGFLTGISGLFLLAAALGFVLNMWRRIRKLG